MPKYTNQSFFVKRALNTLLGMSALLLPSIQTVSAQATETTPAEQPNIVFIIADDLGRQDISLYGSTLYETPNIDKLAEQGMSFDNAYAAHPRCVPSRMSLLSGKASARLGSELINRKHFLPVEEVTFAEHFQQAGYRTGYIGKWHLGKTAEAWPQGQGFDESLLAGSAGAPDSYFFPYGARTANGKATFGHIKAEKGEYLSDRLTAEAEGFISRNAKKPFLLVLSHYAVHTPLQAKQQDIDYYNDKLKSLNIKPGIKNNMPDLISDPDGISQYKSEQNHPVYAAMVQNFDESVARVTKKLEELGLADNTIIMLTSDHGGLSSRGPNTRELATSNLPYRQGKGWLYEGGIRVPFIVKWPGKIKPGSVSQTQVTGSDHFPSLLAMANLPLQPTQHIDGESYVKALKGETYQRPAMFWHSPIGRPGATGDRNSSAMIEGDWKLIHWFDDGYYELFNLAKDKGELNNVAQQNPEKLATMQQQLSAWLKDANALYRKPGSKMKWDLSADKKSDPKASFQWK
ncbi:sulfatase [Thalassomonas sp. M1454]|uniref:sulfatase n=1 Tax=Thalassomonas sp. M1454 TaxID=2594477 RepID=UPI0011815F04|nr:sulfatase [Thalassomonas sp. M1454]TRX54958.1 sulfatase [Thalassomonas sp. M1454]